MGRQRSGSREHLAYPQLTGTEEIEDGKSNGQLGEVFIRCNNVLYIRYVDSATAPDP